MYMRLCDSPSSTEACISNTQLYHSCNGILTSQQSKPCRRQQYLLLYLYLLLQDHHKGLNLQVPQASIEWQHKMAANVSRMAKRMQNGTYQCQNLIASEQALYRPCGQPFAKLPHRCESCGIHNIESVNRVAKFDGVKFFCAGLIPRYYGTPLVSCNRQLTHVPGHCPFCKAWNTCPQTPQAAAASQALDPIQGPSGLLTSPFAYKGGTNKYYCQGSKVHVENQRPVYRPCGNLLNECPGVCPDPRCRKFNQRPPG